MCLKEICMPTTDKAAKIIQSFKTKSGIPQILGVGTHILITSSFDGHSDYITGKNGLS